MQSPVYSVRVVGSHAVGLWSSRRNLLSTQSAWLVATQLVFEVLVAISRLLSHIGWPTAPQLSWEFSMQSPVYSVRQLVFGVLDAISHLFSAHGWWFVATQSNLVSFVSFCFLLMS